MDPILLTPAADVAEMLTRVPTRHIARDINKLRAIMSTAAKITPELMKIARQTLALMEEELASRTDC